MEAAKAKGAPSSRVFALADWLVSDIRMSVGVKEVNGTVMKLIRLWEKHQNYLILPQSPLITLANHPGMSKLRQVIDFAAWHNLKIYLGMVNL